LTHWKVIWQKFKKRRNRKMEEYNTFKQEDNIPNKQRYKIEKYEQNYF